VHYFKRPPDHPANCANISVFVLQTKAVSDTMIQRPAALRFLCVATLRKPWSIAGNTYPHKPFRLPKSLNAEQVAKASRRSAVLPSCSDDCIRDWVATGELSFASSTNAWIMYALAETFTAQTEIHFNQAQACQQLLFRSHCGHVVAPPCQMASPFSKEHE
jgi:hypothetical protein